MAIICENRVCSASLYAICNAHGPHTAPHYPRVVEDGEEYFYSAIDGIYEATSVRAHELAMLDSRQCAMLSTMPTMPFDVRCLTAFEEEDGIPGYGPKMWDAVGDGRFLARKGDCWKYKTNSDESIVESAGCDRYTWLAT
ncbi:hypothetical protein WAI453_001178 [Rhynchosporium graminicola]